ncbi:MAG: type II toxin-antitoxin system VapC family toxin [Bacteroidia bacterium]
MVLCDTNMIIDAINGVDDAMNFILSFEPNALFISVVTEWEVLQGARDKKEYKSYQKALKRYNIIELDEHISTQAGVLLKIYQLSQDMSIPDALIAATAIKSQIPLKTSNLKDFKFIKGLKFSGS